VFVEQFVVGEDGSWGLLYEQATAEGPPIANLLHHILEYWWDERLLMGWLYVQQAPILAGLVFGSIKLSIKAASKKSLVIKYLDLISLSLINSETFENHPLMVFIYTNNWSLLAC